MAPFFGTAGTSPIHAATDLPASLCALATRSASESDRIYVHFTAAFDESKGKKWCPDCVNADPVLEEKLSSGTVVLGAVLSRDEWKENPGKKHPYRTDYGITALPTLAEYRVADIIKAEGQGKNGLTPSVTLVEEECTVPEKVAAMLRG